MLGVVGVCGMMSQQRGKEEAVSVGRWGGNQGGTYLAAEEAGGGGAVRLVGQHGRVEVQQEAGQLPHPVPHRLQQLPYRAQHRSCLSVTSTRLSLHPSPQCTHRHTLTHPGLALWRARVNNDARQLLGVNSVEGES